MRSAMHRYRYWYSRGQEEVLQALGDRTVRQVFVDGQWRGYTEVTSTPRKRCCWDDAVLIASGNIKFPVMIDGIRQDMSDGL